MSAAIKNVLVVATIFLGAISTQAGELAKHLPSSTVAYLEIPNLPRAKKAVESHPSYPIIKEKVLSIPDLAKGLQSRKYKEFQGVLKFLELAWGRPWEQVLASITHNGICVGFDVETKSFVLISKSDNAKNLDHYVDVVISAAQVDATNKGNDPPFTEVEHEFAKVYLGDGGGLALYNEYLVLTNRPESGQFVLESLQEVTRDSLANTPEFQEAESQASENRLAWGFLNLEYALEALKGNEQEDNSPGDPGGEFLIGGLVAALPHSSHLSAELTLDDVGVDLDFKMPFDRTRIEEKREHYFGANGEGKADPPIDVPGGILSVSTYRDVSLMWQRSGDLFNEKSNNDLAKAETGLSTLFSGRNFAEEVLGELEPQLQFVIARQDFSDSKMKPAIQLPGFALVTRLKNPEKVQSGFRRNFINAIGFFNIAGASKGQPQLEIDFQGNDKMELVTAHPVIDVDEEPSEEADMRYNFSPSIAFVDQTMVISSTTKLAEQIIEAKSAANSSEEDSGEVVNTTIQVAVPPLLQVLEANREHLVAKNMLEEGHTQEEAENEINDLITLGELLQQGRLKFWSTPESLNLSLQIDVTNTER